MELIIGVVNVLFVSVSVVARPTNVSVATGNVNTEVPAVAPDNTVVVPDVEPLNLTPVSPNVGNVANTREPEPVSSVTADAKLALVGVPKNVATPAPKLVMPVPPLATGKVPVTPVVSGSPVQLVKVPDEGVPNTGVVSVGDVSVLFVSVSVVALPTNVSVATGSVRTEVPAVAPDNTVVVPDVEPLNLTPVVPNVGNVANTREPEPVSSVTADAKLALVGVPKNVATPAPKLVMPVPPLATGSVPVTLVVKLVNVVDVVPVPPLAIGSVPVTPVVSGSPVAFVSVADAGVPNAIALPLASKYKPFSAG